MAVSAIAAATKIASHATTSYLIRGNCSGVEISWIVQKLMTEYRENKQTRTSPVIASRLITPTLP